MEPRKQLGDNSEAIARQYLEEQGYVTVQQNFRCKSGEIDLIMRQDSLLVFVEVRSRSSQRYGMPAETVNIRKQDKLRRTAACFLYRNPQLAQCYCRFDVVSIVWQNGAPQVEWIADAFQ